MNSNYSYNLELQNKLKMLISLISKENERMNVLLNQFVITEDEIDFIESYAKHFYDLYVLYEQNKVLLDSTLTKEEIKIIENGYNLIENSMQAVNDGSALGILASSYKDAVAGQEEKNEEALGQTKALTLTRKKNGYNIDKELKNNEDYLNNLNRKERLGISGFTNIILILATAITFGMYLATLIFNR